MKVKRIFAALAAVVILCGATGCSSGKTTTDTSPRRLVSLSENGKPVSPGVLRGSDAISGKSVSNSGT